MPVVIRVAAKCTLEEVLVVVEEMDLLYPGHAKARVGAEVGVERRRARFLRSDAEKVDLHPSTTDAARARGMCRVINICHAWRPRFASLPARGVPWEALAALGPSLAAK